MDLSEFIANFADQFEDTDASEITESTDFKELDEWSSLTGMGVIAMVRLEYGKQISGAEIRSCKTVKDLYDLIKNK